MDKKIIGRSVHVKIKHFYKDEYINVLGKVDTGADSSSISIELAKKIGLGSAYNKFLNNIEKDKEYILKNIPEIVNTKKIKNSNGKSRTAYVNLNMEIEGIKINGEVNIRNRANLSFEMLIGARDLGNFLIDVNKK